MDPRERTEDPRIALRVALRGLQSRMWTALPAQILSYDAQAQTVTALPTISFQKYDQYGNGTSIEMPPLPDVPVVFPRGGGYALTFPLEKGDECLLVFASRCIDGWWAQGGVMQAVEPRMHDLSDGFALVGPVSQPNVLSDVSTDSVQLRSDDGDLYIELAAGHVCNIVAPGGVNVTGPINVTGDAEITASGSVTIDAQGAVTIESATSIAINGPNSTVTVNGLQIYEHLHNWEGAPTTAPFNP